MTTLNQGQTASLVLAVGDSYIISSAGTATVRGIYGAPSTTITIAAGFGTFGPYSAPAKLDVIAVSGLAEYSIVSHGESTASVDQPVTVAMVQSNTAPAGGEGYCEISDGDGSIYPRRWRLYWLASGPYYTLADIRSIDGKVN